MAEKDIDLDKLAKDHLYAGSRPTFETHGGRTHKRLMPSINPSLNAVFDDEIAELFEGGASVGETVAAIIDSAYPAGDYDVIDYLCEDLHELASNASREEINEVAARMCAEYYDTLVCSVFEYVQRIY